MKAMIFAAGLGSRLKPMTDAKPKALVTVGGKTLLEHCITKLKTVGVNEIIVNVHHFADQIIDFLHQKNNFDIRIEISDERNQLLDTGGGLKQATAFFDDGRHFFIHNVDILSNADLCTMYEKAQYLDSFATLLVSRRLSSRYFLFDSNCHLKGWTNENTGQLKSPFPVSDLQQCEKLAFGGVHVVSPRIFKEMDKWTGVFSITDFYIAVCQQQKIDGYVPAHLQLMDVGKLDSLEKAEHFIVENY